jgi:hypothetical protein
MKSTEIIGNHPEQDNPENTFKLLRQQPQFDRNRHGSLYDRGSADSYYNRPQSPHWWPQGTGHGEKITDLTNEERAEYLAGYEHNEKFGDKKEWD